MRKKVRELLAGVRDAGIRRVRYGIWLFGCALLIYNVRILWIAWTTYSLSSADYSIFYVAGKLVNSGKASELFSLSAQAQMHLAPHFRQLPLPFNHPPYEALLFAPLARLPFLTSYYVWDAVNVIFLAAIAILLTPWLTDLPWASTSAIFTLSLAFWPVAAALMQGQDSILLTLIVVAAYDQYKRGNEGLAGAILACGLFKAQLLLPLAACFGISQRWKFVRNFVFMGVGLATVSLLMIGSAGMQQYFELLSSSSHMPLAVYFKPELMANLRGLFALITQGNPAMRLLITLISSLLVFAVAAYRLPTDDKGPGFDLFFAGALAMCCAVSFHSYVYDFTLLFPALLLAANTFARTQSLSRNLALGATILCLFLTPLYIYLFYRRELSLMSIPELAFLFATLACRNPQTTIGHS